MTPEERDILKAVEAGARVGEPFRNGTNPLSLFRLYARLILEQQEEIDKLSTKLHKLYDYMV